MSECFLSFSNLSSCSMLIVRFPEYESPDKKIHIWSESVSTLFPRLCLSAKEYSQVRWTIRPNLRRIFPGSK